MKFAAMPTYVAIACLAVAATAAPTPVIFDTDVATDFDDSAAIAFALTQPDIDVKLILTATGDVVGRAKVVAKYLTSVGRTDIPIGIGVQNPNNTGTALFGWAANFNLSSYAGTVYEDGVGAAIEIIKASPSVVTILAIAPCDNFPALLSRDPSIVSNARISAMSGSIYRGYGNSSTPTAEYNVKVDPYGSQVMYEAPWVSMVTTPLDTCGTTFLSGAAYDTFTSSDSKIGLYLAESYVFWAVHRDWDVRVHGDIWFDAVAVLLALPDAESYVNYESLNILVTDDGHTIVDPKGSKVSVATTWKTGQEAAFESRMANSIAAGAARD